MMMENTSFKIDKEGEVHWKDKYKRVVGEIIIN